MKATSKRAFQVAFYGPTGSGKATTLRALHRHAPQELKGPLAEVPDVLQPAALTLFFDYEPSAAAVFRLRTLSGPDAPARAFSSLFACDAVVFVFDARRARLADNLEALHAAQAHFPNYGTSWEAIPKVIQRTKLDQPDIFSVGETQQLLESNAAICVDTDPRREHGLAELTQAIVSELSAAFSEGRITGRPPMSLSRKYQERAAALAAAVDIASSVRPDGAWTFERMTKQKALHPELGFGKLSSLAYLENAFFTYWNEAPETETRAFWEAVARQGLPFQRRDRAREVLERGRIKNALEYEIVSDAVDDPRFTDEERGRFDALIAAYSRARRG